MKRFREIVLNTTAPESPDVVWAKPEDGNIVLYVCDGGKWKKITNTSESGDDSGDDTPVDTNAVEYTPQVLTEAQQMQARQNQGLYFAEIVPARTISWDGETEGKEVVNAEVQGVSFTFVKVLDSFVEPEGLSSITIYADGSTIDAELDTDSVLLENGRWMLNEMMVVCFSEQTTFLGQTFTEGLYFASISHDGSSGRVVSLSWASYTTYSKIEPEYLPLSTNVETDGNSDLMAATPKSVKAYVDSKDFGTEAVKFTAQSLTDSQKMQARQNQGLYYSYKERTHLSWNGQNGLSDSSTVEVGGINEFYWDAFVKVSTNVIPQEDLLSYFKQGTGSYDLIDIDSSNLVIYGDGAAYGMIGTSNNISGSVFLVCSADSYTYTDSVAGSVTFTKGVYFACSRKFASQYCSLLYYNQPAYSKVGPEYLPISTNITTDATSDIKAASPKAVKTYVDDTVGNIETLLAQI